MIGQSKYDLECEHVRKLAGAKGVVLLVFYGSKGHGMSCQLPAGVEALVPLSLRMLADLIERETREKTEFANGN